MSICAAAREGRKELRTVVLAQDAIARWEPVTFIYIAYCLKLHMEQIILKCRHVFGNRSDCPVLASYQIWFGQKLLKRAKKQEMANFGATRSGFHKNSQIFIILLLVLAFFVQFLAKPHLVARQNRTI